MQEFVELASVFESAIDPTSRMHPLERVRSEPPETRVDLCGSSRASHVRRPARSVRRVIMRHGETGWNRVARHTNCTALSRTRGGRNAGAEVCRVLVAGTFDSVLTSPLQLAVRTSEIAEPGDCAEVRAELGELDYWNYGGLSTAEMRLRAPECSLWTEGALGGEAPEQASNRVDDLIAELRPRRGDVALFSPGHTSRCLAVRWRGLPVSAVQSFGGAAAISPLGRDRGHQW